METEKKICFLDDISKTIDSNFITNNVGWCNHGDSPTVFTNNKTNKWVHFNDDSGEIEEFEFDKL